MLRYLLILNICLFYATAHGTLAGGRPNSFSGGENAFAGVVNPANAVWIADRFDLGAFWVHQKSSINNHNDNPLFLPGKTDLTYRSKNLITLDAAIHKQVPLEIGSNTIQSSCSLAVYTMPNSVKLRTEKPVPIAGTTPILVLNKTDVASMVFSLKLTPFQSIGFSIDYLYFSHRRNGYQHSDSPLRSVSPGHVTNNGMDHSAGLGLTLGWRCNITERLHFGAAWSRKSCCGQYKKYRGYEPHHAKNYSPQMLGAGFSYRFTSRLMGRFEVLWSNLGNLPGSNNSVLPNGNLNLHKHGSKKSPGPGLNDATYFNMGMGYKFNSILSIGAGFSHRYKIPRKTPNFLSHTYTQQTIYNNLTLGANLNYQKHDIFLTITYGFKNSVSGFMPTVLGGGQFTSEKQNTSASISWGYMY
jgi:long-chain fatty acid transport protein